MKTLGILVAGGVTALFGAGPAAANDRLPKRLREGYGVAVAEVRNYLRYILPKVFADRLREAAKEKERAARQAKADEITDEVVHLLLPYARKLTTDVLFGTDTTHVRITMPERREAARKAALQALRTNAPAKTVQEAVEQLGSVAERELHDRIEQALLEDMEDYVQLWVEGAAGLPLRGRSRHRVRPLPEQWEGPYERETRAQVHRYLYWWLRKRQRLSLQHLAAMSHPEIDRTRYRGPVWRLLSGASKEAWAQNWLRMGFQWGRVDWEIDRRRIRRRMDQDLALGTWALARLAKEVTSTGTMREVSAHLDRRIREELSRAPLRQKAEQYPLTSGELEKEMERRLFPELDPILNRAMDRVPLEREMPAPIRKIAREHGRRYAREELSGALRHKARREAAAVGAAKRVDDKIPGWVSDALARFDAGSADPNEIRRRARRFAKQETLPRVREEVSEALRDAGLDELTWGSEKRARAIEEIIRRHGFERRIEREVDERLREVRP